MAKNTATRIFALPSVGQEGVGLKETCVLSLSGSASTVQTFQRLQYESVHKSLCSNTTRTTGRNA
jgi:hypothetical protein